MLDELFKIQEKLDDCKKDIPDQVYLTTSNLILSLFKKKEQIDRYVNDNNLIVAYFCVCVKYTNLKSKYDIERYINYKLKIFCCLTSGFICGVIGLKMLF